MSKHWLSDLVIDEISLVDEPANPGARVVLMKRADERVDVVSRIATMLGIKTAYSETEEKGMDYDIAKALADDAGDTRRERDTKAIIKAQIAAGATSIEKISAELSLEGHAAEIRKSEPSLSAEQAYVRAMDLYPDLAALAVG